MSRILSVFALTALWWILAGAAEPASWVVGLPAVAGASAVRHRLHPHPLRRLCPGGVLHFAGVFLKLSVQSGFEVARLAVHPDLPVRPGYLTYDMRVTSPVDRMILAATVNLLPGTVTVDMAGSRLTVHALDVRAPVAQDIRAVENLIAAMHPASAAAASGGPS